MSKFCFYTPSTGEITKIVECNDADAGLNLEGDEKILKIPLDFSLSDTTHYVNDAAKQIILKEPLPSEGEVILGVDESKVIPLPETCRVEVSGGTMGTFDVDDGTLELQFSTPGHYILSFEMTHYIKPEVHIHVKEN